MIRLLAGLFAVFATLGMAAPAHSAPAASGERATPGAFTPVNDISRVESGPTAGARRYEIDMPDGSQITALVPPKNLDFARASDSQLRAYGLPEEPKDHDSAIYRQWSDMVTGLEWDRTPLEGVKQGPVAAVPCPSPFAALQCDFNNWAGVVGQSGVQVASYFNQPTTYYGTCYSGTDNVTVYWTGLGGNSSGGASDVLAQNGTFEQGKPNGQSGSVPGAWWFEIYVPGLPGQQLTFLQPYRLTQPGNTMYVQTSYYGLQSSGMHRYYFYWWNATVNSAFGMFYDSWYGPPGPGAEFIAERALGNMMYHTSVPSQTIVNGNAALQSYRQLAMKASGGVIEYPSQINPTNGTFVSNWNGCI